MHLGTLEIPSPVQAGDAMIKHLHSIAFLKQTANAHAGVLGGKYLWWLKAMQKQNIFCKSWWLFISA